MATLAQLIVRYAQQRPVLPAIGRETQATRVVREYLETHYAENILLEELAEMTQLMPLRLLRVFRQQMGLPPHTYLIQVRVAQAKRLLRSGMAIAQVASDTGFADQSHLTRHFKRILGVTPGQYSNSLTH